MTLPLPILSLGAGRMGGALLQGLAAADALSPRDLLLLDPAPGEAARALAAAGARLNPAPEAAAEARLVLLAVKPQGWRAVAEPLAARLAPDVPVLSVLAGVRLAALREVFGGRPIARVMPTTAVAVARGSASVYAPDAAARAAAHALFSPVAAVVDLADEGLMDAATAVSGSAPAYLYAFVEALEAAGVTAGLTPDASAALARSTVAGAAALMAQSTASPAELRAQVTSPGGTTQAALDVLQPALGPLLRDAVRAAAARSRELAGG